MLRAGLAVIRSLTLPARRPHAPQYMNHIVSVIPTCRSFMVVATCAWNRRTTSLGLHRVRSQRRATTTPSLLGSTDAHRTMHRRITAPRTPPLVHDMCYVHYSLREYAPGSQHISRPRYRVALFNVPLITNTAHIDAQFDVPPENRISKTLTRSTSKPIECNGVLRE
jgi:hypothetical protein